MYVEVEIAVFWQNSDNGVVFARFVFLFWAGFLRFFFYLPPSKSSKSSTSFRSLAVRLFWGLNSL